MEVQIILRFEAFSPVSELVTWPRTSCPLTSKGKKSVSTTILRYSSMLIRVKPPHKTIKTFEPLLERFVQVELFPSPVFMAIFSFCVILGVMRTQLDMWQSATKVKWSKHPFKWLPNTKRRDDPPPHQWEQHLPQSAGHWPPSQLGPVLVTLARAPGSGLPSLFHRWCLCGAGCTVACEETRKHKVREQLRVLPIQRNPCSPPRVLVHRRGRWAMPRLHSSPTAAAFSSLMNCCIQGIAAT